MQSASGSSPIEQDERASLRRAYAELEAAKQRVERDAARTVSETRTQLVTELLPVLDNLDRTILAGTPGDAIVQGVTQVRAQLEGVLRGYGLERFDATGERFDPRVHDAVLMSEVPDRARDGMVVDQLEAGYRAGGRVLRPAKVAVGRFAPSVNAPPAAPEAPPRPSPEPLRPQPLRRPPPRFPWAWSQGDDDDWF